MKDLVTLINEALVRCNRHAQKAFRLPDDYDCFPLLIVDKATGKCTGIKGWRARISNHQSDDETPELATEGICRGSGST